MWTWVLNTAWMLKCGREEAAFSRACREVAGAQAEVLRQILDANGNTWFGRKHRFEHIADPAMYGTMVPAGADMDFAEPILRIASGEQNVLTGERVVLLEPTSGTTGGEKLIPYSAGLRRQFQRGVAVWIADLFRHRPAVRQGRAYWSISPALGPTRYSPGGLPIGFADDTAYVGRLERFALRRLLVVPDGIPNSLDIQTFRHLTLRYLLAAHDLALISVWSPTFLLALVSLLPDSWERVCHDLQSRQPARADFLREVWRSSMSLAEKLRAAWPRLALISCWTDGAAGQFIPELRRLFPAVEIQPKGLLATEGFVSLPLIGQPGAALAVRCHFFEFEEMSGGRFRLAHELERGGRYRVLLTTAGGLYRYRLGDEIEVVGFLHRCPLLRFVGKSELVGDLVGEKLAEPHVRAVLDRLRIPGQPTPRFMLLVPVFGPPPRYRLYLQGPHLPDDSLIGVLVGALQVGLEENPYYKHAVGMGQLAPAEVALLDPAKEPAWLVFERRCLEEGQKCGNIKPLVLDRRPGWPERFAPLLFDLAHV